VAHTDYDDTVDALSTHVDSVTGVADSFVRIFPVAGASVSTLGDFLGNETLSASDDLAARIDEVQFDLGEGPCWDALATRRPVLEPDLWAAPHPRWPVFSRALSNDRVGALFAFPMTVGQLRIGAIDLYAPAPTEFDRHHTRQASVLAGLVAKNVLRLALMATTDEPEASGGSDGKLSRRVIHQATGMVLAQLDISAEEAHLVIQGHAFASGRSMMAVADDIIAGRMGFHDGPTGIEERP
jgi:hypothetical protein